MRTLLLLLKNSLTNLTNSCEYAWNQHRFYFKTCHTVVHWFNYPYRAMNISYSMLFEKWANKTIWKVYREHCKKRQHCAVHAKLYWRSSGFTAWSPWFFQWNGAALLYIDQPRFINCLCWVAEWVNYPCMTTDKLHRMWCWR